MEAKIRKKGFVLTLDATIAIFLVIIIMLTASYYINKAKEPALSKLQLVKRGSDDLLNIYYQGNLEGNPDLNGVTVLNQTKIYSSLTATRIPIYNMQLAFNGTGTAWYPNFTVGDPRLSTVGIGSSRMVFVLHNGRKISQYYTVRYYIWSR